MEAAPEDLLHRLFAALPHQVLITCRAVCWVWRSAADTPDKWRKIAVAQLQRFATNHSSALASCTAHAAHIVELSLRACRGCTDSDAALIAPRCTTLTVLDLSACGVGDRGLSAFAQHCPLANVSLFLNMRVSDAGIVSLATMCCSSLTEVDLRQCPGVSDCRLTSGRWYLISHWAQVEASGVRALGQCVRLRAVNIKGVCCGGPAVSCMLQGSLTSTVHVQPTATNRLTAGMAVAGARLDWWVSLGRPRGS